MKTKFARIASASERRKAKESLRIVTADNVRRRRGRRATLVDPESDAFRAARIIMLGAMLPSSDPERLSRVSGEPLDDVREWIAALRRSRVIHLGAWELGELMDPKGSMAIWLYAFAATGEMDRWQPCRKCKQPCHRAGRSSTGKQRWRCGRCGHTSVYPPQDPVGRMLVPDSTKERAWSMFDQGSTDAEVARACEISPATVRKLRGFHGRVEKRDTRTIAYAGARDGWQLPVPENWDAALHKSDSEREKSRAEAYLRHPILRCLFRGWIEDADPDNPLIQVIDELDRGTLTYQEVIEGATVSDVIERAKRRHVRAAGGSR